MLSRYVLAVALLCFALNVRSDDEDTSQWVKDVVKESSEEVDLTPTNNDRSSDTACRMDNNAIGECVPYYLCDPDTYTIIVDGSTLIDVRQAQCGSYLSVCCALGKIINETEKKVADSPLAYPGQAVSTTARPSTTPSMPGAYDSIGENDGERMYTSPSQSHGHCGWNDHNLFIKGSFDMFAKYGEFPWAVALLMQKNSSVWTADDFLGGGTLIHPSVVLTVAHKVDTKTADQLKIRAGEWDTQTTREKYPFQERGVRKIVIHPNYYKTSLYYDAALLFLNSPFELAGAPHIQVACIGRSLPKPGTECFSMGWGPDFLDEDTPITILKKIPLPLVGANDCEKRLQKSRLGRYFRLHKSLTCAGGQEDVDTCNKDGGSSLVCPIDSQDKRTRYAVYGAAAYGIGSCGTKERPGVYLNVPEVSGWIDQQMDGEKYGTSSYQI